MGKNFTMDELIRTARLVREFNLPTMWFFIFGGPGETDASVRETMEFIDGHIGGKDMVHMTCGLRVYPGTELHRIAVGEGFVDRDDPLTNATFYVSPAIGRERLLESIENASRLRPNCVPVTETTPPPEMMREAMMMRGELKLTEPMFRTLLRLRYRRFGREMPS